MKDGRFIQVGQVWVSDSGVRYLVTGFRLPSWESQVTKVYVNRLNPPKWDDGKYVFASETFKCMKQES